MLTLGAATAILIGTKLAITTPFRTLKAEVQCHVSGLTAGEGEGLTFGLADGQFSVAQIEAALETTGPVDPNSSAGSEISERFVKRLGVFENVGTNGWFRNAEGGFMMITKPRWTFDEVKSWNWFIYNDGSALTTGSTAKLMATDYGVWVR